MDENNHSVRSIFLDAMDIADANARAAFVAKMCQDDDVKHREVLELIDAESKATDFLPKSPSSLEPSERVGEFIGRYKLLQVIGEGGCGTVYLAQQDEPVRRKVALKVIKIGMDTRQVIARFEAERQALALMEHPNIAKVLDAGATPTGRPYFVMEWVRGIRITEYCQRHQLAAPARLQLFAQVCHAVQHAHQKGIIHRDLKPSNILISADDGQPSPKIIDFGIAKATEGRLTDHTAHTAFEQFLGTPAYMSPEQAAIGLDIDTRSDIYSLGVLLYELLTGATPFETKELLALGLDEMRRKIRETQPLRPSARLVQTSAANPNSQLNFHSVRGDLDWIVMKCLEKDRTRRYATAHGLATDIHRHLAHETISARPPSRLYELRKVCRRHRLAFASAALIILALTAGIAALAYGLRRARAAQEAQRFVSYATDMTLCQQRWIQSDYPGCRRLLQANLPRPGEPDLRSFEWYYLHRLSKGDDLFSLGPTAGEILGLAFLPGHRLAAAVTQIHAVLPGHVSQLGGGVFIWDLNSKKLLTVADAGNISYVSAPADGSLLAASAWGTEITILDGSTYQTLTNIQCPTSVYASVFSPDGAWLAIRGRDAVYLWNRSANKIVESIPAAENYQEVPAFSADSRLFAFVAPGNKTGIWSLSEHRLTQALSNAGDYKAFRTAGQDPGATFIRSHSFSPDGTQLASCDLFGRLITQDLSTGETHPLWEAFDAGASVSFAPDGKSLAFLSESSLNIWDPVTGDRIAEREGHNASVEITAFAPDGQLIFTGGRDGCVRAWNPHGSTPPQKIFGPNAKPNFNRYSPNGRKLFSDDGRLYPGTQNDTVEYHDAGLERTLSSGAKFLLYKDADALCHVADLHSGAEVATYRPQTNESFRAISPDGQTVLSALDDGAMLLRAPQSSAPPQILTAHSNRISIAAFSADNRKFATTSHDGWLKVWDAKTARLSTQTQMPGNGAADGPQALAFSADGSIVACAEDSDPRVLLLNLTHGTTRLLTTAYSGWTTRGLSFSPDGKSLAVSGYTDRALVIDLATGAIKDFIGDGSFASFPLAEFTPDGKRLALADIEIISFWDLQSKRCVLTIDPHSYFEIDHMHFSPDGQRLSVTTIDNICRTFSAPRAQ